MLDLLWLLVEKSGLEGRKVIPGVVITIPEPIENRPNRKVKYKVMREKDSKYDEFRMFEVVKV